MLEIEDGDLLVDPTLWPLILKDVSKDEALEILEEIKENINVCCAITMEPDEVLVLIDKLEKYLNDRID